MDFRHEWKHRINYLDLLTIRQRMKCIAEPDVHAVDGCYHIRSLYFDTPADTALREKVDGINRREKYRLRYYNRDTSLIHLEKKSKLNGLCSKQMAQITAQEAQKLVDGELDWMMASGRPLVQELYAKMKTAGLRPKTIVDYTREPFVYGPGNVRVTLDYGIRTGLSCTDFLNPRCMTVPIPDDPIILEIKWDAFLPSNIRAAVQMGSRPSAAFSKYAQCRVFD